jgi:hypothetical protein
MARKATLDDLLARAVDAIERDERVVDDVAGEFCQIADNVKHMTWFKQAVARQIAADTARYRHLAERP